MAGSPENSRKLWHRVPAGPGARWQTAGMRSPGAPASVLPPGPPSVPPSEPPSVLWFLPSSVPRAAALRWARRSGLGLAVLALLLALAGLAALALAFEPHPRVAEAGDVAPQDIERALALARSHDPRGALPGIRREARLAERDLDLLLNHAARRWLGARVQVTLGDRRAALQASALWPGHPLGEWLNLRAELVETPSGLPQWQGMRLGRLPVPAGLAKALAPALLRHAGLPLDPTLAADIVAEVRFSPGLLRLGYAWQPGSTERVLHGLLSPAEQERLLAYQGALAQAVRAHRPGWTVPLTELLPPLFALAQQRSADGGDAAAENRAALLTLTFYANHRSLAKLVPQARMLPAAPPRHVLLAGRADLPRHFLVSATLVTESTHPLAQAIGLHKELSDARGGSGFSFNDMAANLAGVRLGRLAQAQPQRLQAWLAAGVDEAQILPRVDDLPEHLPEAEFVRRFGGVDGKNYRRTMAQIEARVAALPALPRLP